MAVRATITVSVTPELRAFIKEQLASGYYGNASEVVRAALRLLIHQNEARPFAPSKQDTAGVSDRA